MIQTPKLHATGKFTEEDTQAWGDAYKALEEHDPEAKGSEMNEADAGDSETTVDEAPLDGSCDVLVVDKGQPSRVSLIRKLAPKSCRVLVWSTEKSTCKVVQEGNFENTQCFKHDKLSRGTPQRAFLEYIVTHYSKLANRLY